MGLYGEFHRNYYPLRLLKILRKGFLKNLTSFLSFSTQETPSRVSVGVNYEYPIHFSSMILQKVCRRFYSL